MKENQLEILRFPLVIMVIFIHIIPTEIRSVPDTDSIENISLFVKELISHSLGRLVVPAFFVISGYTFFLNVGQYDLISLQNKLTSRVRTLLLPYLSWSLIFILVVLAKNYLSSHILGSDVDDYYFQWNSMSFLDAIWNKPFLFPLWYVRDLMVMVILSPLLYYMIKYLGVLSIVLLSIIYLSVIEIGIPGFSSTAFFFFSAGSYFALKGKAIGNIPKSWGWTTTAVAFVFMVLTTRYFNTTQYYEHIIRCFVVVGLFSLFFLGYLMKDNCKFVNLAKRLNPSVFFIYAVHQIYIINWVRGALKGFFGVSFLNSLSGYFLVGIITLLCSYGCYKIFQRFSPRITSILTGQRK